LSGENGHFDDLEPIAPPRAIAPVHYAGVSCEMDSIMATARRHGLKVVEDAAQGIMASYNNSALGAIGDLGGFSFHETKNIISGEGGSLLVNDRELALAPKSCAKRALTAAGSFAARSINIPGWISVRRSCRAKSPPPISGPSSRRPNASPASGG
jgi:dTDP-4-amino-4,6-dideoxygalactose transaminase